MHPSPSFFSRWAALFITATLVAVAVPALLHAESFPALNHPATAAHTPGRFIWGDLFTSQPEAAANFYTGLFGWTAAPVEQNDKSYYVLSNAGQPVAGIVQRSFDKPARPGVWVGYIAVASVKSTLAAVTAAGGTERTAARDFPHRGIQAIFTDSEGSVAGLLQSSSGDPADDEPDVGTWNWFQLFSSTPAASADFYRKVIGYQVVDDTSTEKDNHVIFVKDGTPRAGLAPLPAREDSRSGWIGSVRVADIEATATKAAALGGRIIVAPRAAAHGSRFAVIADPTGGELGLVQYVDSANPKAQP